MNKRPISYFEADGSYNERPPRKRKPPVARFTFDWTKQIVPQVSNQVSATDSVILEEIGKAVRVLETQGILPGNRINAARRQVEMKAERMMRKYAKRNAP